MITKNKIFSFSASIAVNGFEYKDFESDNSTDDYAPFKNITLLNTGLANVKIFINGGSSTEYYLVPAGTIFNKENISIANLKLVNDSATAIAEFTYSVDNSVSQLELLTEIVTRGRK